MSDYVPKRELIEEILRRIEVANKKRLKARRDGKHLIVIEANAQITVLRALRDRFIKPYVGILMCSACDGSGKTKIGLMPWEVGNEACTKCDGTGKKKTVIYG
jgi:DnaJ-class molecular chaperone